MTEKDNARKYLISNKAFKKIAIRYGNNSAQGQVASPKRMNFWKNSKGGGYFQSKYLCCRFWIFKQVFLCIKFEKNCNMIFQK